MLEPPSVALQSGQIPGGIALWTEKGLPHVVVDAEHFVAQRIEMRDGFGSDEPTTPRHEDPHTVAFPRCRQGRRHAARCNCTRRRRSSQSARVLCGCESALVYGITHSHIRTT